MDCANCDKVKKAEEKNNKTVSWAYVELLADNHKATVWKLWVVVLVLIVALAVSNMLWLRAWNEYDYSTTEIEQDGRGINIIGDDNDTEQLNEPAYYYTEENP
jgi:hypothetical protein